MSKISLVISVYKKIRELDLILTALKIQNFKDFEVIIADDGSGLEMKNHIESYIESNPYPIKHIFHQDLGFRKNKILNKSIKNSESDYIVFIDGDCIPHSNFLKEHFENIRNNTVVCGRRVNLSKKLSTGITKEKILNKEFEKINIGHIYDSWKNSKERSTYIEEGLLIKSKLLRRLLLNDKAHIVGCNFSMHKNLLERINGFDESYQGPGIGEDSDIEFRLRLIGVKFQSLRNLAILFHLHHPETKKETNNIRYFEEVQKKGDYLCKNGIKKL